MKTFADDITEDIDIKRAFKICCTIQGIFTFIWVIFMILHYVPGLCASFANLDVFFIWLPLWIFPVSDFCCMVVLMLLHALYKLLKRE